MIRITRQTDYGIILLSRLADQAGAERGTLTAPELAEATRLMLPMVSKILKLLTRAGLLVSHRGVYGGYELAREAQQITVSAMIEALEGPIAMTACVDETAAECEHVASCSTQGNWLIINRAIRDVLENITLAEMAQGVAPGGLIPVAALNPASGANSCVSGSCGCTDETQRERPRNPGE